MELSFDNLIFIRFVVVSNWESEASLETHMKTDHVKMFGEQIKDHSSLEVIRRYQQII